jgi:hypothetical protein
VYELLIGQEKRINLQNVLANLRDGRTGPRIQLETPLENGVGTL